jgi:putative ABC transport system permease protein
MNMDFIKMFTRVVARKRGFFLINLFGLTLGLTVSILLLLFVLNELSYDRFNKNSKNIYRLTVHARIGDTRIDQVSSSALMFQEMRERFPEIVEGVKISNADNCIVKRDDLAFSEDSYILSDSTFFDVFTFPILDGNTRNPLGRPNSVVLSETYARKYFGNESPIGKVLEVSNTYLGTVLYQVTAVYKDMPPNSHFHFNMIFAAHSFPSLVQPAGWTRNIFTTYFLLEDGASYRALEDKYVDYVKEKVGPEQYEAMKASGSFWTFNLQPLEDIHLHSDLNGEWETNGNISYVYIFIGIALFVLIIACINYINLSTAKAASRAREVGVRKVAGSTRQMLIMNFIGESVIITFLALLLSLLLVSLLIPVFSNWLNRDISFHIFSEWYYVPGFIGFGLVLSLITGIYPALVLSGFSPQKVLKGHFDTGSGGVLLRNILVVVQFAASIFLIISTLVIRKEFSYLQRDDLGFSKKNVLMINIGPESYPILNSFREEMKRNPGVLSVSESSSLPGMGFSNLGFGAEGIDNSFTLNVFSVDDEYGDLLNLKMADGRFLSKDYGADSTSAILNETAVKVLGIDDPIGLRINDFNPGGNHYFTVVGVVKDYHYESLHSEIRPMVLISAGGSAGGNSKYVSIRYAEGGQKEVLSAAERNWKILVPGVPFTHTYLEDEFNKLYVNEAQTMYLFTMMAVLSILVACLGLFGLASFISRIRAPEVAIRKVYGASIKEVVLLLVKNYAFWLFASFIIASPVSLIIMNHWLENFAFKVNIGPSVFLVALFVAMLMALLTVAGNTVRAAITNPAITLRNE